jgi:hypothetical protein
MRYAARIDDNKAAIVAALRSIGAVVYDLKVPVDLLVLLDGRVHLVEIKDGGKPPSRRGYTPAQQAFIGDGWPVKTLYSASDALAMAKEIE